MYVETGRGCQGCQGRDPPEPVAIMVMRCSGGRRMLQYKGDAASRFSSTVGEKGPGCAGGEEEGEETDNGGGDGGPRS